MSQMTVFWLIGAIVVSLLYAFVLREWWRRWGATRGELTRVMPGDIYVHHASYSATLAVTVDAPPEGIWPWLVQMGYRRGGLYSYDWLDRLFGYLDQPSATVVLPEFQRLSVGDEIPMGRGSGFPVQAITPYRSLVLAGVGDGFSWVWQFGLYPIAGGRTRLISRNAVRVPKTISAWLFMRVIEPAAFVMTRKMLLGIKNRIEGGPHMRRSSVAAVWLFMLLVGTSGAVHAQQTGRGNPPLVPDTMYGPDLFKFYCAPCHGLDGKGHGPVAPVLKTAPSDLTQIAKRNGGVFPADRVEALVTNGLGADPLQAHGTPEMPVWGPVFRSLDPSDARVQVRMANLIAYFDAIQAK